MSNCINCKRPIKLTKPTHGVGNMDNYVELQKKRKRCGKCAAMMLKIRQAQDAYKRHIAGA